MTKHVHAELMLQYAQDAMETDKPWERWQYGTDDWGALVSHPVWSEDYDYRRKPKVILINGHEVPEPMRVEPELGKYYYTPRIDTEAGSIKRVWDSTYTDRFWLARGLCHSTKEAAELHVKALLSFTEK